MLRHCYRILGINSEQNNSFSGEVGVCQSLLGGPLKRGGDFPGDPVVETLCLIG